MNTPFLDHPGLARCFHILLPGVLGLLLTACGGDDTGDAGTGQEAGGPAGTTAGDEARDMQTTAAGDAGDCAPDPGIEYLCGPRNAEDLVRLGNSRWLLASGMDGQVSGGDIDGRIHLIDHQARRYEVLFPGDDPRFEQDEAMFGACPGPLDTGDFSAHGLALRPMPEDQRYRLYVTGHGEREAIEVFDVDAAGEQPSLTWVGCVPMPESAWTNSVTILPDGGFYATQFIPAGASLDPVLDGEITGHVFEWHPGGEVEVLEGSELSGANGIVLDEANNQLYVAAYGTQEIVRFDLDERPVRRESVSVDIHPDNLRWTPRGTIYTAGGIVSEDCGEQGCGWAVLEVDPNDMSAQRVGGAGPEAALQGASVALPMVNEIWVGTYAGDRVGILPAP